MAGIFKNPSYQPGITSNSILVSRSSAFADEAPGQYFSDCSPRQSFPNLESICLWQAFLRWTPPIGGFRSSNDYVDVRNLASTGHSTELTPMAAMAE